MQPFRCATDKFEGWTFFHLQVYFNRKIACRVEKIVHLRDLSGSTWNGYWCMVITAAHGILFVSFSFFLFEWMLWMFLNTGFVNVIVWLWKLVLLLYFFLATLCGFFMWVFLWCKKTSSYLLNRNVLCVLQSGIKSLTGYFFFSPVSVLPFSSVFFFHR